jgi:hypothetical protein
MRQGFLTIICAGNSANAVIVFILLFLFRDASAPLPAMLLRTGLCGLGYIVLSNPAHGKERPSF